MTQFYWVGDSGSYNDSAHWSLSSGGAGGAGVPSALDDVIIDNNSFSADSFVINVTAITNHANNFDASSATKLFTLQFQPSAILIIVGDLTLSSFMSVSVVSGIGSLRMSAALTNNLTTNGCNITSVIFSIIGVGVVDLQDDMLIDLLFIGGSALDSATFNTNDHAITAVEGITIDYGTFNAGASVLTVSGEINTAHTSPTAVFNAGTSTIVGVNAGTIAFDDSGQVLYDVELMSGTWQMQGATTLQCHNLTIAGGVEVDFLNSVIYVITNQFNYNGSLGNYVILKSDSAGNTYEIDAASASGQYAYVQDCIAGGAASPFNDLIGGVDAGNNTGWIFGLPVGGDDLISVYDVEILDPSNNLVAVLTGYIANLSFVITRNRPEEISFSIPINSLQEIADNLFMDIADLLQTGIQTIRIKRKGVIIVAGQMDYWSMDFQDPTTPMIQVKAHGWLSLLSYRLMPDVTLYTNKDANFIIHDVITTTQSLFSPHGDFGITFGVSALGTNFYPFKQYQDKNIMDVLVEFAEEAGGVDFNFTWDKVLNVYWPYMGVPRPDILFTYPGNITTMNISSDTTQIANQIYARAQGNGGAEVDVIVQDMPSWTPYKVRNAMKDYPDTPDETQVTNFLTSEVKFSKAPLALHSITYLGNNPACPQVGTYYVGDRIRILALQFPFLQNILNDYFIIDKQTVNVDSTGKELVQLDFTLKTPGGTGGGS